MTIEVLEPAPDKLLTSLDAVKTTMGITNDDGDPLLLDIIKAASQFVVSYTGRDFALQTVKESKISNGDPELLLSITPIVEIEKVELDDHTIDGWVLYDAEAGIIQRRGGFQSTNLPFGTINRFPSSYAEKRWHITYTGGFILPGWGSSHGERNFPYDLERAVIDMVKAQVKTANLDTGMTRYKIGETQITWAAEGAGSLPKSAENVLNYYRRAF